MKIKITVLILLVVSSNIYNSLNAQNMKGIWNLREKDSLLEYASNRKYYKGIIWNYNSSMHELIPKGPKTFEYVRTGRLRKTRCIYNADNAEDLIIQIFSDFSKYNNKSSNCQTSELKNYHSTRLVGKDQGKMVGYDISEDENLNSTITKQYLHIHEPNKTVNSTALDSIIPIAQLNDACLYEVLRKKRLLLEKDDQYTLIKGINMKQLNYNENFNPDVVIGKNQFYLQIEEDENEYKIISLNPKNGEISTIVEDGYAPRFYDNHLYFMNGDGLIKLNLADNSTSQILTKDQVDAIKVKSNYTFLEDQLIWGNENIYIAKIDFLQAFNFGELNEIKGKLAELQDQLNELGFEEFHILDPYEEMEEVVDAPPQAKFSDLPENEQKLINEIKDLREKRKNIRRKLSEQMKAGAMVEKSKRGVMPEEYKLMQNPVTREPIFVTNQIGWPIYTWRDIIMLPPVIEQ